MVERLHRRLKEALLAASHDNPDGWFWKLPSVLLSLRVTLKPDLGASPAEMLYGEPLAVPGTLLSNFPASDDQLQQQQRQTLANLRLEVARLQPTPTSAHRRQHVRLPEELATCTHVFIKKGTHTGTVQPCLATPYSGPYRVLSRQEHFFRVSIPGRGAESVALARLKPAFISNDLDPQQAPVTPPPRRGPGRPPKQPQEPSSSSSSAPQQPPTLPPPRRGPGRPRKNPQQPSSSSSAAPHPPSTRPRGRPRKNPTTESGGINAVSQPSFQHFPPSPTHPPSPPHHPTPERHAPPHPHHSFSHESQPVSHHEPNDAHLQPPAAPSTAATSERERENTGSSARTRPRPDEAACAAGPSPGQTSSSQLPSQTQTGSIYTQARAAAPAAAPVAAPQFSTRPQERTFSAQRKKDKRPTVSYAASLAAILQHQLS